MTPSSPDSRTRPALSRVLLGVLGIVAALGWPLLVYALLSRLTADSGAVSGHSSPWVWALILFGALLIQRLPLHPALRLGLAALLVGISVASEAELGLRAYPVLVNLAMLSVFATSLWRGMPVIERLARLKEPDLPLPACATPARSPGCGVPSSSSMPASPAGRPCMPTWRPGRSTTA
ncbi:hypothetical protein ACU8V3_09575 [Cobetia marina]